MVVRSVPESGHKVLQYMIGRLDSMIIRSVVLSLHDLFHHIARYDMSYIFVDGISTDCLCGAGIWPSVSWGLFVATCCE